MELSKLAANKTLDDFDQLVSASVYTMLRAYGTNATIVDFLDKTTGQKIHLPKYFDSQDWYVDGKKLVEIAKNDEVPYPH